MVQNMALGIAQIFLWGGSFFILSILDKSMMEEMGWSRQMIYGALSLSLTVSGLLAPIIGRHINVCSNNNILLYSGFMMGSGLVLLGISVQFWTFLLGWIILGIAMSMGLYDALFASLGKKFGTEAQKSIVQITLVSGFAPTISWAMVSYLTSNYGWRNACIIYAIILFAVIFPIHRFGLGKSTFHTNAVPLSAPIKPIVSKTCTSRIFYLLLLNFTIGALLMTGMALHLIDILLDKEIEMATAVALAGILGPSQVGVRLLGLCFPHKTHLQTAMLSSLAILAGLMLLFLVPKVAFLGIVLFGMGNGMRSILRGTLPLYVFGNENYAHIMGKLARLPLIAQAITPFIGGYIIEQFGIPSLLCLLCLLALINVIAIFAIKKAHLKLSLNTIAI